MITALKQVEAGRTAEDVAPEYAVSKHTIYAWKSKYGAMEVSEAEEVKHLRDENARLKILSIRPLYRIIRHNVYLQIIRYSVYCGNIRITVWGSPMDQITRTPKQLGTILRRRRKEVGLSQEGLASRIHLRQATISALENSATDTRLDTVFDALAALDLELVVRLRTKGSARDIEGLF